MTPHSEIRLNGERLLADPSGALVWPARRLLVVADLHLEKGSSFAMRGRFLPPYDTAATLRALGEALERHDPETVICLGDSFHDQGAGERLDPSDGQVLQKLIGARDWIWVAGNHDPLPPDAWGGRVEGEVALNPLTFRHEAHETALVSGEISGHYHPKAAVRLRARRVTARCFVTDGRRLILPAFGAYTGGLDVLDPAIADLFRDGFRIHLLGAGGVYRFPKRALSRVA